MPHVKLKLNNTNRFESTEGRYFRLVEPWQYHTNIPRSPIYSYSFSMQPEDVQPSGSCNFSRIDNSKLDLSLDARLFIGPRNDLTVAPSTTDPTPNSSVTFLVYAINYNIVRFKFGLGGLKYGT